MSDTTSSAKRQALAADYIVPPFSVLDARSDRWQSRKRQWIGLGIGEGAYSDPETRHGLTVGKCSNEFGDSAKAMRSRTSEFDPVLAEVLLHWFSCAGDVVVDPFSGGPVRGAVAHRMGRRYFGCDLRPEQVASNAAKFAGPSWVCDDAANDPTAPRVPGLVMTCPPYGPLERYSDDPRDLSTMGREEFVEGLRAGLRGPCGRLKDGGFCVVVISDVRGSDGAYWGIPQAAHGVLTSFGLVDYAKLILVTRTGSAAIRARSQMEASRKPVLCHQDVLVFLRGEPPAWHQERPVVMSDVQSELWGD